MRNPVSRAMVFVLACGTSAAVTGLASGHEYVAPTTTTMRYVRDDGVFRGRIESPRPACETSRRVKLVKQTDDGRRVVGRTRSNSRGRWRIEERGANGVYRAVVPRRANTAPGHVHDCERGASSTVTVNP